jgi:hypothetical protein
VNGDLAVQCSAVPRRAAATGRSLCGALSVDCRAESR